MTDRGEVMDYINLARELLSIRTELNNLPIGEAMIKMSEGEYYVLTFLLSNGFSAHPSQLSRSMSVSSARIAALLNRLEEKGMICRTCDPKDDRKVIVTLTEKGKTEVSSTIENTVLCISKTLEKLGEYDAEEYIRIQKKLLLASSDIRKERLS